MAYYVLVLCIWCECGCGEVLFAICWDTITLQLLLHLVQTLNKGINACKLLKLLGNMCSIQLYFAYGNNLYTYITGDPVKRYTTDNIIVVNLIQSVISGSVTKCGKCLIKCSVYCIL